MSLYKLQLKRTNSTMLASSRLRPELLNADTALNAPFHLQYVINTCRTLLSPEFLGVAYQGLKPFWSVVLARFLAM